MSVEYDVVISGANDGVCLMHSLSSGEFIRSSYIVSDEDSSIKTLRISYEGMIVVGCSLKVSIAHSFHTLMFS